MGWKLLRETWRLAAAIAFFCLAPALMGAASEFDPLKELHERERIVIAPPVKVAPTIDGKIAGGEWDGAGATTGFHAYTDSSVVPDGPVLFAAYSETDIYLLVITPQDPSRPLSSMAKAPDQAAVTNDDSIELFLSHDGKNVYQFVTNSAGVTADLKNNNLEWNGRISCAPGQCLASDLPADWGLPEGKYWFAEAAIPFATVEAAAPKTGDRWAVNAAVNRSGPWTSLAELKGKLFSNIESHPALVFAAPGEPYVQLTSLGRFHFGEPAPRGRVFNPGSSAVSIGVDVDMRKEGSRTTEDAYRTIIGAIKSFRDKVTVQPGSSQPFHFPHEATDTAINRMAVRVSVMGDDGKPARDLLLRRGDITLLPPLVVKIGNVPPRKYAILTADTTGLKSRAGLERLTIEVAVSDAGGREVMRQKSDGPAGIREMKLDWSKLPVGEYSCAVRAVSATGEEIAASSGKFCIPETPAWLKSTVYDDYGKLDRVPLPWRPVKVSGRTVDVWGRAITWEPESILPSKIKSVGAHLLSEPMKLAVSAGGREFSIPMDTFRVTKTTKTRVTMVAEGKARGIGVRADMFAEFDGFIWVTLSVRDEVKGRKVDSMRIVTRMPAKDTTLYQTFNRALTGDIGGEPIRIAWQGLPNEPIVNFYHWLGNEDRGLGFTYTSLEHWLPRTEDNFATILPGREHHTYAINLVEKQASVDGRKFTVGIQATPIKPLPPDYHGMIGTTKLWQPWRLAQKRPELIDIYLVWPEPVTTIMLGLNNPYNVDTKQYLEHLKESRDAGISLVTVASCPQKVSYHDEWMDQFDLEWKNQPESVLNWNGVATYQNCGRSLALRKWLFYGWAIENVKKLGTDGIYFDGWQSGQMGCSNPHHGCGWTDAGGKRHLTIPVLEGREFNQRMCLFLEDTVKAPHFLADGAPARPGFPRYHYWIHSWEFVPSVMGYATEWLTGEFTGWPQKGTSTFEPGGTFADCMGLGFFRTRGLSTHFGVTNMWLPMMWEDDEELKRDHQTIMALAWLLPHGVPVGGASYLNRETLMKVTDVLLSYEHRKSVFTPGWRPNPFWKVESPIAREVLAATWNVKGKDRVLAVVSNLRKSETHDVTLKWTGFPGARVTNALTGEQIPVRGGRITVTLKPETFVLVAAEKAAQAAGADRK